MCLIPMTRASLLLKVEVSTTVFDLVSSTFFGLVNDWLADLDLNIRCQAVEFFDTAAIDCLIGSPLLLEPIHGVNR